MTKTIILDFDGTLYNTPCNDIPKLEDAIDISQLLLLKDKLKSAPNKNKVLALLDEKFDKLDKSKVGANLYNQNADDPGHKSQNLTNQIIKEKMKFSDLLKRNDGRAVVFCARALAQMMEPETNGNHRVSGMLNLGLDITQKEIASYYRKYATIKYKTIKPNILVKKIIEMAKKRGDKLVIYTDNSKENIISNLEKLGYKKDDFTTIVDMFDCRGGNTKKTLIGRNAFKNIMESHNINLKNAEFYDDNPKICTYIFKHLGVPSFCVKPSEIVDISNGENVDINHKKAIQERIDSALSKICPEFLNKKGNPIKTSQSQTGLGIPKRSKDK